MNSTVRATIKYDNYVEKKHRLSKEIVLKESEYLEHINQIKILR
jgi:hypothetical protein